MYLHTLYVTAASHLTGFSGYVAKNLYTAETVWRHLGYANPGQPLTEPLASLAYTCFGDRIKMINAGSRVSRNAGIDNSERTLAVT